MNVSMEKRQSKKREIENFELQWSKKKTERQKQIQLTTTTTKRQKSNENFSKWKKTSTVECIKIEEWKNRITEWKKQEKMNAKSGVKSWIEEKKRKENAILKCQFNFAIEVFFLLRV